MEEESYLIPKHLDDPAMYLLWDADEVMAFLLPFMFCMLYQQLILGAVVGFVAMRGLAKVKSLGGKELIKHALYWYSPSDTWFRFRTTPHSFLREFIG